MTYGTCMTALSFVFTATQLYVVSRLWKLRIEVSKHNTFSGKRRRECTARNVTGARGAAKVHEGPGVLAWETKHVSGLEVPVHPPAAVQLRQPLRNQTQCLRSHPQFETVLHHRSY